MYLDITPLHVSKGTPIGIKAILEAKRSRNYSPTCKQGNIETSGLTASKECLEITPLHVSKGTKQSHHKKLLRYTRLEITPLHVSKGTCTTYPAERMAEMSRNYSPTCKQGNRK